MSSINFTWGSLSKAGILARMIVSGQVRSEPISGWHCVNDRGSLKSVERVDKSRSDRLIRMDQRIVGVMDGVRIP